MYSLNYLNLGEYQQVLRTAYLVRFLSEWTLSSTAGRGRRRTRHIQPKSEGGHKTWAEGENTEPEEGEETQAEGGEPDIWGQKTQV